MIKIVKSTPDIPPEFYGTCSAQSQRPIPQLTETAHTFIVR